MVKILNRRHNAAGTAKPTSHPSGWRAGGSKKSIDFTKFNPSFELSRAGRSEASPVTEITMTSGRTTVHWDEQHGFTTGKRPLSHSELQGLEAMLKEKAKHGGGVMRPELAVLPKVRAAIVAE